MKNVILSADGNSIVYSVPDEVADNLSDYCLQFCSEWLPYSPDAARYRVKGVLCYDESDFISYLNQFVFPDKRSEFVADLGWIGSGDEYPVEFRECPRFNF